MLPLALSLPGAVDEVPDWIQIIEVRYDLGGAQTIDLLKRYADRRTIFTVRLSSEGGRWAEDEGRLELYLEAIRAGAWAVDVEIGSRIFGDVLRAARREGVKVIASYHNVEATPHLDDLVAVAQKGYALGADMVKVVTMAGEIGDNVTLLSLPSALGRPAISFAMGQRGVISRVFCPFFGSPFTYAAASAPTAPGQLHYKHVILMWRLFGLLGPPGTVEEYRALIDSVDYSIISLLEQRLGLCRELGELKRGLGLPVEDQRREMEVLRRAGRFEHIYRWVVEMCRGEQRHGRV